MKHVNLDPYLEKKKEEIMEQFRENEQPSGVAGADGVNSAAVHAQPVAESGVAHPDAMNADRAAPSEEVLRERVVEALKSIYDPEIPVNIFDLGLIYRVDIKDGFAEVDMTLTAPGCPVAQTFPGMVEGAVRLVPGIRGAAVELVWEPPWTQALISEAARLELGLI